MPDLQAHRVVRVAGAAVAVEADEFGAGDVEYDFFRRKFGLELAEVWDG